MNVLDNLFKLIWTLAFVNILWLLFSLLGVFIFGVFPATVAALSTMRKMVLEGDVDFSIWKHFTRTYKREFLHSNMLGLGLGLVGAVLYFNYTLMHDPSIYTPFYVPFAFYFIVVLYATILIWVFNLYVHYELKWFRYIKYAVIIGIGKLHYTFMMLVFAFSLVFLSLEFPSLLLFFTVSAIAIFQTWISLHVFQKIDTHTVRHE